MSRLEPWGKDVRAVTLYTHSFTLLDGERADEQKQLSYTATAPTPEEAEALAFVVYQSARECRHVMQTKGPTLSECAYCGIQRRTAPMAQVPSEVSKPQSQRRFLGFLGR